MLERATTLYKAFKYKLEPTPEQEQVLDTTLYRCRTLYNVALEQRRIWWGRGERKAALNKSISDAGWAQFRKILEYKAVWAGKRVIAVPPAYTSQDCSGCGERIPKSLSIRTHICPSCGLVLDRDENAAVNILRAGQARQGLT